MKNKNLINIISDIEIYLKKIYEIIDKNHINEYQKIRFDNLESRLLLLEEESERYNDNMKYNKK